MNCKELTLKGQQCSREGKYNGCCKQHHDINNANNIKLIEVVKAHDDKHKFVAVFDVNGHTKKTPFGAEGYEDYTIHKDKERRERYRIRHDKDLDTNDPTRAGLLSYYILWGDSSDLNTSIKQYKKRFNL
jgi:hypothetical protein